MNRECWVVFYETCRIDEFNDIWREETRVFADQLSAAQWIRLSEKRDNYDNFSDPIHVKEKP